jgi:hypothetical protein
LDEASLPATISSGSHLTVPIGVVRSPSTSKPAVRVAASVTTPPDAETSADSDSDLSRNSSCSSRSVRSSISDSGGTRLRLCGDEHGNARRKYDAAVSEALRKGDAPFLCNVLGYEETVIEFCVRQKTAIVKKLLVDRPDLMVDADQFIPQPGVLLNDSTSRSLGKTEYIKAFSTYSAVLFELQST